MINKVRHDQPFMEFSKRGTQNFRLPNVACLGLWGFEEVIHCSSVSVGSGGESHVVYRSCSNQLSSNRFGRSQLRQRRQIPWHSDLSSGAATFNTVMPTPSRRLLRRLI